MLILASQSPRRRQLLEAAGLAFTVRVSGAEEVRADDELPEAYVERLARDKALAIDVSPDDWVLAADTTVAVDHHVLEKPADPADAARMLALLSGRDHWVYTGICLRHGEQLWSAVEATRVTFSPMNDAEIAGYVASGEPMDKAGAYGIQGRAARFIPAIEGCFFNVMGLPISRVYRLLGEAGYPL